jgi:hypothetical protein
VFAKEEVRRWVLAHDEAEVEAEVEVVEGKDLREFVAGMVEAELALACWVQVDVLVVETPPEVGLVVGYTASE